MWDHNKDTTAWGAVSVALAVMTNPGNEELLRQFLVIVVFPSLGWLGVYLFKKAYLYLEGLVLGGIKRWWENRKAKKNSQ
jgi:hypothetical protein